MRMPRRQSYKTHALPKIWLMTDPRLGDGLLAAVRKLPFGSGVVFRHYDLAEPQRYALFRQIARLCRLRGHQLLLAGKGGDWAADGVHGQPRRYPPQILSMPVHNIAEIRHAKRIGADLVFLSPLLPTRSHPGGKALGMARFSTLARLAVPMRVIALGGVTQNRAHTITARTAYGWAGIDAFLS
jgi:thiamine-phosphate pyrophosphorylase